MGITHSLRCDYKFTRFNTEFSQIGCRILRKIAYVIILQTE